MGKKRQAVSILTAHTPFFQRTKSLHCVYWYMGRACLRCYASCKGLNDVVTRFTALSRHRALTCTIESFSHELDARGLLAVRRA